MSKLCVVYLRTSTKKQNIQTQEWECKHFAKRKGLVIKSIHRDHGISGDGIEKRKGLSEAISALEDGDIFLVRSTDRLSRDMNDARELEKLIKSKGGYLVSILEDISLTPLPDIDGVKKPCYVYLASDNDTDLVLQIKKCKEYALNNHYNIIDMYIDHDTDDYSLLDRPILSECINKLDKGDMIITYALKYITTCPFELSSIKKVLSKKGSSIAFIVENTTLNCNGYVMLSSALMVIREQLRTLDKDHILNLYLPLISTRYEINHNIKKEELPDEDNGYLYIFMTGDKQIGSAKTITHICDSHKRRPKTSIYLYPCKNPDACKGDLIAWLIPKKYVDYEDSDDTVIESADIQAVLSKMKELTGRDPLITTMGDLQKQVDKNGSN